MLFTKKKNYINIFLLCEKIVSFVLKLQVKVHKPNIFFYCEKA